MTEKSKVDIFVSYAQADRDYGQKLVHFLSKRPNVRVFTTEMLSGGEDWQARLREEIARSNLFLVILSSNSVDSKWVLHELGAAWATNKPIISFVTQPDLITQIPVDLKETQVVNIKDIDEPKVVSRLLEPYEAGAASVNIN